MAYNQAGHERKLQLQVLEELRLEADENSQIYKEKVKRFHDKKILRKEFNVSQKILLFNSQLKLIVSKLRSRWDGLFVVTNVFPYGVVEVRDEVNNQNFMVNGHQLKPYYEGPNLSLNVGELITSPIPRKTMIHPNLGGQRSFGIVLGVGSTISVRGTP
ncbi:hypothetical protein CR513_38626, partial [Mucuna pruriens]